MLKGQSPNMPVADRFWARVKKTDGCWLWTGARNEYGYGEFAIERKIKKAHRVAFFLTHGRWPEPNCLHTCDNPPCVNPDHLIEGTHTDNMRDCYRKGRQPSRKGQNAKVTVAQVLEIRNSKENNTVLAERFKVVPTAIAKIRSRQNWAHIP